MQLRIETKKIDGVDWLYAKAAGELDMAVSDEFRDRLNAALKESRTRNLLLDFSAVDFIDSSGLGVILGRFRQLAPLGGKVAIAGANPQIYRLLTAAGLHKVIDVYKPSAGLGPAKSGY